MSVSLPELYRSPTGSHLIRIRTDLPTRTEGGQLQVMVQPVRFVVPSENNGWQPTGWADTRFAYWVYRSDLTPAGFRTARPAEVTA